MGPECAPGQAEVPDPMCPTTNWSDWSPCSASCGKGVRIRMRLLLVEPGLQEKCRSRVELVQQAPCVDTADCTFDMATAKVVCMQDSEPGPCQGYFNRWYFDSLKLMCLPFVFGGCRGNRNNFLTAEECNEACAVVRDALSGQTPQPRAPAVTPETLLGEPVDCMVTEWSNWSLCSATCGVGFEERFRIVKRPAEYGGRPCPAKLVRKRRCFRPQC